MPWIRNEDAAIKRKFLGLKVDDGTSGAGRDVVVRFRLPETELADATFPMIIINPASQSRATDREHRGPTTLPYFPEPVPTADADIIDPVTGLVTNWDPTEDVNKSPFRVEDYPIPYNFDYPVTVYARKQDHAVQLMSDLAQIDRIPERFGYLEVPEDGTVRTLELLGGPDVQPDKDGDGKRIFRVQYIVRIVSELSTYEYHQNLPGEAIQTVDIDVSDTDF